MSEVRGLRFTHHSELREDGSKVRGQLVWLPSAVPPLPSLRSWLRWAGRRPLQAVFRPPSSPVCRLSSVVCHPSSAFTLVELLVVISIIALLLGIIVPSYFSIREKAKYTKAKVTVKNLETAFKAYLDHYRTWPAAAFGSGGAAQEIDENVVKILRGEKVGNDNTDKIAFYEFETTNSPDGALDPFADSTTPAIQKTYRVQLDDNYDNKITVGGQDLYRTVIVWSVGTNRLDALTEPATKEGNVKSWD
ncbi:MAG: prepilin-type N-terminal cleavage/methylation domain-containing protein [Kiritimatiellaeota bacterium]|nr:prepilin-type N-terminal cleavage/methylation domain-containing protein [Kiritimatiellota bacterium]